MLYEFGFQNYRSYKSKAVIDFTAKQINEFKESLICADDKTYVLPACVIYGPNGGGKSSVLYALLAFRYMVISPLVQVDFMKNKNEKLAGASSKELQAAVKKDFLEEAYYKWDDEGEKLPVEFSILFKVDDKKYRYEAAVMQGTICRENLYKENLCTGEITAVFERDDEEVYLCEELETVDLDNVNEGLLLLSYIAMFKNIKVIDEVVGFFLSMRVIDFDNPIRDRKVQISYLEKNKKKVLALLSSMGIDICDIKIQYDEEGKVEEVYTKHRLERGGIKTLNFKEESSGTRKIFSVLPVILDTIEKGKLLVVDELDAKLHPMLLQRIIELFTVKELNPQGAQLLFTSHDLMTMSNKVFRRDEIWFSAMNAYDESVLYSLADFRKENEDELGSDETYHKQYLEGRYGADPYMCRIKNWEEI